MANGNFFPIKEKDHPLWIPTECMLLVPTYVAPSAIAGVGLFAAASLPAGLPIWHFDPSVDWRLTKADFERFPEPYRDKLAHYLYEESTGDLVLCGDGAKFMNHSDLPNCRDDDDVSTITARVIAAGEELTCDYRAFDAALRSVSRVFPAPAVRP